MEAWRYSALNTQFLSLQQKLLSTMQTSKDNNAASIEPMDSDFYNNNLANVKTGLKRRAVDDLQNEIFQGKFGKRDELSEAWSTNSCLKLDVYTQTEASHVTDTSNKSLQSYISDMVQANNKKLENIEKFLETLGCKIEGFLVTDEPGNELAVAKKMGMDLMSPGCPMAPEADSRVSLSKVNVKSLKKIPESPRDTNFPALADSTKSPKLCPSPGLMNNSVSWSAGFQQRFDTTGIPVQQGMHARLMERSELGSVDSDVLVPVIVSLGDKSKKNATTEIPLQDIVNGATCTLEGFQHLRYSQGFWFGDRNSPFSRVWFCGDTKLLSRAEASGTNPAKLSLNLLEALFSREEMAASNINGARGRELLNPIKIKAIQAHINYKFPIEPDKEEMRWRFIKPRIDSKCRAQRRLQREQLAKFEGSPGSGGSELASRNRLPRVDPREKDQLLYGYSRSTELGLSIPGPQVAGRSFQGTVAEVDESQLSDASPLDQLQPNETIVEISGTPVVVE